MVKLIIFLLVIVGLFYILYKEIRLHELINVKTLIEQHYAEVEHLLKTKDVINDKELEEILKGELLGIEKVVEMLDKRGAKETLCGDIKNDIIKIKNKVEEMFE